MNVLQYIVLLTTCYLVAACSSKKDIGDDEQYTVEHVEVTVEMEDPGPPPDDLTSSFRTVTEWLTSICNSEKPVKEIQTYSFWLFEQEGSFTICLVGTNTYEVSQNHSTTVVDFRPKDVYFPLPKEAYNGFSYQKVADMVTVQIREFLKTDEFKRSFLSKAGSIHDWNGEIWSR